MLKFIMRKFYHNRIYTDEPELFYKLYQWNCGLFTLLSLRNILGMIFFGIIGIGWMIFIKPRMYGLGFIDVALLLLLLEIREAKRLIELEDSEKMTPKQIRTTKMEGFIRKFVSQNGGALGKKEWKAIKKADSKLYKDLLCENCNHCCYYYSLAIAKIIKDSILIWGAVEEPFEEGHKYLAHAVILRNGYVYDSNMRLSAKYEDFIKLYKFKTYKQWNYPEYSRNDFRESEREEFRKWCKENNVLTYHKF